MQIGTSLFVIFLNCVAGLIGHASQNSFDWKLTEPRYGSSCGGNRFWDAAFTSCGGGATAKRFCRFHFIGRYAIFLVVKNYSPCLRSLGLYNSSNFTWGVFHMRHIIWALARRRRSLILKGMSSNISTTQTRTASRSNTLSRRIRTPTLSAATSSWLRRPGPRSFTVKGLKRSFRPLR